jgi:ornithine carbamoyltransferase
MPVRRGVAVQDAVLDGRRSALTLQAENRMWSQMAVLYRMLRGD